MAALRLQSNADEVPPDGRRIKNREEFMEEVRPGSHIAERSKLGYYHHYLVEKVSDKNIAIIEYGRQGKFFLRVKESSLQFDEIDFKLGVYLIKSFGYPESIDEKEKAIRRARSRLGEDNYSLAINNCEHFVTWALTGRSVSYQTKDANVSKEFGIDLFDACCNKKTACKGCVGLVKMVRDLRKGRNDGDFKASTEPKQLEVQGFDQPMTPTSPAKTSVAMQAKDLAMVTTTSTIMSVEKLAMYISNSSKQIFPDIPVMLKIDPSLPLASLETALRRTAGKYVDNSMSKLVSDIFTMNGIDLSVVQTAKQAIGEKAGELSIQAGDKIALETAKTSAAAAGTEAISQAAKQAAKFAAITTTVIETIGVGYNIYKLNEGRNNGTITDKVFQRGVCTKITGAIGSIAGSTLGAAIGQAIIPIPGVGALVGSMFSGLLGKMVSSRVAGFLFDKIMK